MQIDPSLHSVADNYKLLTNLVVPRLLQFRDGAPFQPQG
jgi:hypothetical protein